MATPPSPFSTAERDLIRSQFMIRFGQAPNLAGGISLRKWQSGPQAGEPRIPQAVASLIERGLMEVGRGTYGPCARFTPAGIDALRLMVQDQRALDPAQYAHLREQLGLQVSNPDAPGTAFVAS